MYIETSNTSRDCKFKIFFLASDKFFYYTIFLLHNVLIRSPHFVGAVEEAGDASADAQCTISSRALKNSDSKQRFDDDLTLILKSTESCSLAAQRLEISHKEFQHSKCSQHTGNWVDNKEECQRSSRCLVCIKKINSIMLQDHK